MRSFIVLSFLQCPDPLPQRVLVQPDVAGVGDEAIAHFQVLPAHGDAGHQEAGGFAVLLPIRLEFEYLDMLAPTPHGGAFVGTARPVNHALLVHVVNLFLELFGECDILDRRHAPLRRTPVRRLNWTVLPPGEMRAGNVVIADISAYFENVDIGILMSDLKERGAPEDVTSLLSRCLNRWAILQGRGLPQSQSPSDILGKLYLHNIDVNLEALALITIATLTIFGSSAGIEPKQERQSRSSLGCCAQGVSISQSAKLGIFRADYAKKRIKSVTPVSKSFGKKFINRLMSVTGFDDPYATITDAEVLLDSIPDDAPTEIVREAYTTHFIDSLCIECDACIDICPVDCLAIAPDGEEGALRRQFRAPADNLDQPLFVSGTLKQTGRVMLKDENICLHCGLCAERCPTYAWDMRKFVLQLPYAGRGQIIPLMAV